MLESKTASTADFTAEPVARPAPRSLAYSANAIASIFLLLDGIAVFGSGLVAYLLHPGWNGNSYLTFLSIALVTALLVVAVLHGTRLYRPTATSNPSRYLRRIIAACVLVFLLELALLMALSVPSFYLEWLFLFLCFTIVTLYAHRALGSFVLRRLGQSGLLTRNIILIGATEQAEHFLRRQRQISEPWNQVLAIFDDHNEEDVQAIQGVPVLGGVDSAIRFARTHRVDEILITYPGNAADRIAGAIERLRQLPVQIGVGADLVAYMYGPGGGNGARPVPTLSVVPRPLSGWKFAIKEMEDKLLALALLIVCSPVLAVVAIAIKLESRGPVLFRQARHGFNNQSFSVFKFRSMYSDQGGDGSRQTERQDPRTTSIGRVLRKTSLDELPQLFNVLTGDMSVVGPRPHPIPLSESYAPTIDHYYARHRVKPGITGLAQISGYRGPVPSEEHMRARVDHDNYYIDNWSVLLDVKIVLLTIWRGFKDENAY